jgi:thiamine-phosphate pyrophosphorylase
MARDPVETLGDHIHAAVSAGADWVQVREKDLTARALFGLVRRSVEITNERDTGARVVVNDRIDVALAAGAHGVHLGHDSIPAKEVVRWCRSGNAPTDFFVGVSCHSLEEVRQAEQDGASYVFFGPVFETPSKIPFGRPQGIAKLEQVCRGAGIPVIAIGGVNRENSVDCLRASAAGIAAIRLFQETRTADKLADSIRRLRTFVKHN